MEVILLELNFTLTSTSILHVCGGDPSSCNFGWNLGRYSPRMWRWSRFPKLKVWQKLVFSTYVEVILRLYTTWVSMMCILHVCGGDPQLVRLDKDDIKYSPRMWRWSPLVYASASVFRVFSTYVEVILLNLQRLNRIQSILHVCGGDPHHPASNLMSAWYSPRMWRWSFGAVNEKYGNAVFSTHVESVTVLERTDK